MMAKSSKLKEWLDKNPSPMSEALTALNEDREEDRYVDGINGDRLLVKDVVRDTHTDVKEIKNDIQILRDVSNFNTLMKKFKGYWFFGFLILILLSLLGLDIAANLIKTHIR